MGKNPKDARKRFSKSQILRNGEVRLSDKTQNPDTPGDKFFDKKMDCVGCDHDLQNHDEMI